MGKIQDDEVSMVNIYYVIKMLGSKAGATAEGILKCFLEHTLQNSRALWRKIKKKLNLGVIAKIFEYSDGHYWIAADPDADVVIPSPSHSAHSSRCSTPERHAEGSATSLPVATPPPDVPDESSPPPRWLGEYLRLHVHSMRTERALQRYKILGGVKEHYAAKRRYEESRRRRTWRRDATCQRRRRRATCRRSPKPVQRRRRLFVTKKRLRTRRCDDHTRRCDRYGPCVANERNHKAVIEVLSRGVTGFVDIGRSSATDTLHDIFNSELKIDFSPKSTSQDVCSPLSSDVPSPSKSFGVGEDKRPQRDTLGHTSKTNATSKQLRTHDLQENTIKLETLTVNPRTCTTSHDPRSADDSIRPSRSIPPKTSVGPKGADVIRALGMEGLVTVVNNPMKNRRKLNVVNNDGPRSDARRTTNDAGTERRSLVRDVATETRGGRRSRGELNDEEVLPNKRYRRT